LGKDWKYETQIITMTHTKVNSLTIRVERVSHKLYMDNSFSPPDLFDDLHAPAIIDCCGTVRENCKGMLGDFDNMTL
jgi:hypothetical protein